MAIRLVDKIKPRGNFPIADAEDVVLSDGVSVEEKITSMLSEPLKFTEVSTSNNMFFLGDTVEGYTFTWELNKEVSSISISGDGTEIIELSPDARSYVTQTPITDTTTYTITASDGYTTVSESIMIEFGACLYYGSALKPDTYDAEFVKSLAGGHRYINKDTPLEYTYYMDVRGDGKYGYWAVPVGYSVEVYMRKVEVNGMAAELVEEGNYIPVFHDNGKTVVYRILRTPHSNIGQFFVHVNKEGAVV